MYYLINQTLKNAEKPLPSFQLEQPPPLTEVLFACDSPAIVFAKIIEHDTKNVEKPLPSSQLRQPPPITEVLPANVVGSPAKKKTLQP